MKRKILIAMVGFLLIASIIIFEEPQPNYEKLAKCLTEKGAKLYGSGACLYSNSQKKAFNNASAYLNYINCDENAEECHDANITEYPIWVIDGKQYPGEQEFEKLGELTGCELH